MSRKQLKAAMDLVRRLPPAKQTKTLSAILSLIPEDEFAEELLADVDQPLKQRTCEQTGQPFIICEYNRDADSFRSPWSNEYYPPLDGGVRPSPALRQLEERLNAVFSAYCAQYYGSEGVSSCYCWDGGEEGAWACAVLFRKDVKGLGAWNSMHVLNVQNYESEQVGCYQMTSSVMLGVTEKEGKSKTFRLAGNVAKQWKQLDAPLPDADAHITNIGSYVQKYENKLRGNLGDIYFGKALQVTEEVRSLRADVQQFHMLTMTAQTKRKRVWKQYVDEEGNPYWYNTVTGDTQWDQPEDVDAHIVKEKKSKKGQQAADAADAPAAGGGMMGQLAAAAAARAQQAAAPAAQAQEPEAKKAEKKEKKKKKSAWKKMVDDESGEAYWYNAKTQETTWEQPDENLERAADDMLTGGAEKPSAAVLDRGEAQPAAAPAPSTSPRALAKPGPGASVDGVCAWLATLGLSADYSDSVRSNAIDGEALSCLGAGDIADAFGIKAFGDKKKVIVAMGL